MIKSISLWEAVINNNSAFLTFFTEKKSIPVEVSYMVISEGNLIIRLTNYDNRPISEKGKMFFMGNPRTQEQFEVVIEGDLRLQQTVNENLRASEAFYAKLPELRKKGPNYTFLRMRVEFLFSPKNDEN